MTVMSELTVSMLKQVIMKLNGVGRSLCFLHAKPIRLFVNKRTLIRKQAFSCLHKSGCGTTWHIPSAIYRRKDGKSGFPPPQVQWLDMVMNERIEIPKRLERPTDFAASGWGQFII